MEKNLQYHILKKLKSDNQTLKFDFILMGFGLWALGPGEHWDWNGGMRRFEFYNKSLPGIVKVRDIFLYLGLQVPIKYLSDS